MKGKAAGILLWGVLCVWGLGAQEAYIKEVYGVVEVKGPGEDRWVPAAAGQRLEREAVISTGFRSGALIGIGETTLVVRPVTRLSIEELREREGNEQIQVYLRTGRVRAEVRPPAGMRTDFTVRSPSITASVRGTVFEFDGMQVRVEEGLVYMSGGDGSGSYVSAGHTVGTDRESGRTVSVGESVREELEPPLPAGMDRGGTESPGAEPSAGDIRAGFRWE
jgi:hypothetical protein